MCLAIEIRAMLRLTAGKLYCLILLLRANTIVTTQVELKELQRRQLELNEDNLFVKTA